MQVVQRLDQEESHVSTSDRGAHPSKRSSGVDHRKPLHPNPMGSDRAEDRRDDYQPAAPEGWVEEAPVGALGRGFPRQASDKPST